MPGQCTNIGNMSENGEIVNALNTIDTSSFGSHLAEQMVEDWIDTCNRQIKKAERLASGNEFYSK